MPPRKTSQTAPESADDVVQSAESKRSYTPPPAGLLDQLASVEVMPDDTSAFGRGSRETIPADHPMVVNFLETYKHQKAAKFVTTEPDASINVLRRIAADQGKGIRTSVTDLKGNKIILPKRELGDRSPRYADVTHGASVYVVFMGRDKKNYTRKVNDGTGTSGQLPTDAE